MTGRKPKPAALTNHTAMKKNKKEIEERKQIEAGLETTDKLSCPSHMSPLAKKEWRRVMKLYKQMDTKILNDLDITALTMYCEAVAIYKTAQQEWMKLNVVVTTNPKSQAILDKIRAVMNEQAKIVCQLSEQLCLSPVGRARMGVASKDKEKKNPILELLQDGKND